MSDETTALDEGVEPEAVETETTDQAAPEPDATDDEQPETDELDADAEGDEDTAEDDEEVVEKVEIDLGGNKLSLNKGDVPDDVLEQVQSFVKDSWAATTKRNQENAEKARSLEAREAALGRLDRLEEQTLEAYSDGHNALKQLQKLPTPEQVRQLWQSPNPLDRDRARQLSDTRAELERDYNDAIAKVNEHEKTYFSERDAEMQRRREEGKQLVERMSPGFTKDLDAVIEYASSDLGVDEKAAREGWADNPAMAVAVRKAMLYDRMKAAQQKQGAGKQKPVKAPEPSKPLKGKGGPSTPDISRMSEAQMAKHLGLPG